MTLTYLQPCEDLDCPTRTIELSRPGTDLSDLYTSDTREAWRTDCRCLVCGDAYLLVSGRWFKRADGLEVHQRVEECESAECGHWRVL